jgi:hypothetical protein
MEDDVLSLLKESITLARDLLEQKRIRESSDKFIPLEDLVRHPDWGFPDITPKKLRGAIARNQFTHGFHYCDVGTPERSEYYGCVKALNEYYKSCPQFRKSA